MSDFCFYIKCPKVKRFYLRYVLFCAYLFAIVALTKISFKGGPGHVINGAFMVLKGHRSIVNQVRFNPHTYMICSSGVEKVIKVSTETSQHLQENEEVVELLSSATSLHLSTWIIDRASGHFRHDYT